MAQNESSVGEENATTLTPAEIDTERAQLWERLRDLTDPTEAERIEQRILVGAEVARLEGRALDAMDLYERAIRSAEANGFVHNEALANELAARFYGARGFETISRAYLRNARNTYLRCGAAGKVRQLDQLYPYLTEEEPAPLRTGTIDAHAEHLDISQAAMPPENARLYSELSEREARIWRLVNIIGIFIWDFDGRIFEANEAFLQLIGYDREDLFAGRIRWTDLTPPDGRERDEQWMEEHRRTRSLRPYEKEYFRKDGSRVPVLLKVVTFEEGGSQGVAFVIDLSERKRAEEVLHKAQADLAHITRITTLGQMTA